MIDHIVGMHNGTLSNADTLVKERGLTHTYNLPDSYAMFQCIAHDNNPSVLKEIKGPAAVLFSDLSKIKQSNLLYACRATDERPLFRGLKEEGMYISSEAEALKIIGCKHIKDFKVGFFYTLENGKIVDYYRLLKEPPKAVYHTSDNTTRKNFWVRMITATHFPSFKTEAGDFRYCLEKKVRGTETYYVLSAGIRTFDTQEVHSSIVDEYYTGAIHPGALLIAAYNIFAKADPTKIFATKGDTLYIQMAYREDGKDTFTVYNRNNRETFSMGLEFARPPYIAPVAKEPDDLEMEAHGLFNHPFLSDSVDPEEEEKKPGLENPSMTESKDSFTAHATETEKVLSKVEIFYISVNDLIEQLQEDCKTKTPHEEIISRIKEFQKSIETSYENISKEFTEIYRSS